MKLSEKLQIIADKFNDWANNATGLSENRDVNLLYWLLARGILNNEDIDNLIPEKKKFYDLSLEEGRRICGQFSRCEQCPLIIAEEGPCYLKVIEIRDYMLKANKYFEGEVEVPCEKHL